jgi:hypothetical protein
MLTAEVVNPTIRAVGQIVGFGVPGLVVLAIAAGPLEFVCRLLSREA